MTKLLPLSAFVGFESLFEQLNDLANQKPAFPPHDIVKRGDTSYIELAVAGFRKEDISISLRSNILTVTGQKATEKQGEYQFKGISAKAFAKSFRLSEYAEVQGAVLEDGILSIALNIVVPKETEAREIAIS